MEMYVLFGVLILLAIVASLILPWINMGRISALQRETKALKSQLRALLDFLETKDIRVPRSLLEVQPLYVSERHMDVPSQFEDWPEEAAPAPAARETTEAPAMPAAQPADDWASAAAVPPPSAGEPAAPPPPWQGFKFEENIGAKLPVWLGGVALALAGFFLVKYSIDNNLLSPVVRCWLGLTFGFGLLAAGDWVRRRPGIADGARIGQALTGAGLADLYVSVYAATTLYQLIPPLAGFLALGGVTAAAVILSLRHGMPIALIGMIGGFLTPAMVSSGHPQAAPLFVYLYFVLTGLLTVIRRERWWGLSIPAVFFAFMWVLAWLFSGHFTPGDSLVLGLFLIAVSGTVVVLSKDQYAAAGESTENAGKPWAMAKLMPALNYLSLGAALLLMGVVAGQAGFGRQDWVLFGLLAAGCIGLAAFNQRLYGMLPWLSMAVNAVMLFIWSYSYQIVEGVFQMTPAGEVALTLSLFAALYVASGYVLQAYSERPLAWAGLSGAAALGFYLLGYFRLGLGWAPSVLDFWSHPNFAALETYVTVPHFWAGLALALAAAGVYALHRILNDVPPDHPRKQHLLALWAAVASAFVALALTVELKREFLSVALTMEMLALAWINTKTDIRALRALTAVLAGVFAFLLLPQILLLAELTVHSLTAIPLNLQESVPIVNWPLFQLGIPALMFIGSAWLLRQQEDRRPVAAFELTAIALTALMGYYLMRHAFHMGENVLQTSVSFLEGGVITNALYLFAVACLWLGRVFERKAVFAGGAALAAMALFRTGMFDFLRHNPLFDAQNVGATPLVNALLVNYGLPILWIVRISKELFWAGEGIGIKPGVVRIGYAVALFLGFALLSFEVRQLYQGALLNGPGASNMEIYTYSAVWLIAGLALLFLGTLKANKMLRIASLLLMILTSGKVFLYDTSALEGLYRVVSFFGLGLSLIGLSWFYTRFVFARTAEEEGGTLADSTEPPAKT